jgi:hypothetical protein
LYGQKLPWEVAEGLNPFRSVLDGGFALGFGSDGMPFGPLRGLAGATGHPDRSQRLTVHEALAAYTTEAAAICGMEELSLPLDVGRRADMVLLSGNPFLSPWGELDVLATISAGRVVYGDASILGEVAH